MKKTFQIQSFPNVEKKKSWMVKMSRCGINRTCIKKGSLHVKKSNFLRKFSFSSFVSFISPSKLKSHLMRDASRHFPIIQMTRDCFFLQPHAAAYVSFWEIHSTFRSPLIRQSPFTVQHSDRIIYVTLTKKKKKIIEANNDLNICFVDHIKWNAVSCQ